MERKIGEIFKHNGEWYQCVESSGCALCAFNEIDCNDIDTGSCEVSGRSDEKSVVFKKLEKVGESYSKYVFPRGNVLVQRYKLHIPCDTNVSNGYWIYHWNENLVDIEIKQNKEDMKTVKISKDDFNFLVTKIRYGILPKHIDYDKIINEISKLFSVDDTKHSNTEKIGKNLKPFDLQAAKSGKPVCTRDGRKARIICCDFKRPNSIIALVENGNAEDILVYPLSGEYHNRVLPENDLFMLPEKKEGWINIIDGEDSPYVYCAEIYPTKTEALANVSGNKDYIATVQINWEE